MCEPVWTRELPDGTWQPYCSLGELLEQLRGSWKAEVVRTAVDGTSERVPLFSALQRHPEVVQALSQQLAAEEEERKAAAALEEALSKVCRAVVVVARWRGRGVQVLYQ